MFSIMLKKYLCKYFHIDFTQENLNQLENIDTNISKMENTIENLNLRQRQVENDFKPPQFILEHYYKELMEKIGINIHEIKAEYSKYISEYISPGGNSSQRSIITFNAETVESISEYISEKICHKNSTEGQRNLMTKA